MRLGHRRADLAADGNHTRGIHADGTPGVTAPTMKASSAPKLSNETTPAELRTYWFRAAIRKLSRSNYPGPLQGLANRTLLTHRRNQIPPSKMDVSSFAPPARTPIAVR